MKSYRIILSAFLILFMVSSLIAQEKKSPGSRIIENMNFPELKWDVPVIGKEVTRTVLDNGMILFLMEDRELPLISAHALVRSGSIYDSKEDQALAGITGTVMRTGGTRSYSPDSLNAILEFIAGHIECGIGNESGSASLSVMSKDIDLGLELFYEVLRYPAFDSSKIELQKSQIKESIRRRNDNPGSIISREFYHLLYGDHPYGSIIEWSEVKDISGDDLMAYYNKYFHPNNIMIAFSGDFKIEEMIKKVKKVFGKWKRHKIDFPEIPEVEYSFKPGVYIIDKDITQANVRVGHLGIKRDNPDRWAISLMNYILGGGSFTSRLTSRVRSDEGLAYSVRSSFSTGSRDYGTFMAYTQTKTATAKRALELFFEEFENVVNSLPSEEELESARESYLNNFIFQFDSPAEIVNRLMALEYDDYPEDYYRTYLDNIKSVTPEDIQRVALKYLHPDSMSVMLVVDTTELGSDLSEFGSATYIELKEPIVE
ncbi:MAG: insulinase family protein [Candidatus Zixiibacteriota bacterium]|nr:MAG: insulinase family protein [candidate division Zixibacteria bacterium]